MKLSWPWPKRQLKPVDPYAVRAKLHRSDGIVPYPRCRICREVYPCQTAREESHWESARQAARGGVK